MGVQFGGAAQFSQSFVKPLEPDQTEAERMVKSAVVGDGVDGRA